jgi:hypothetical protein
MGQSRRKKTQSKAEPQQQGRLLLLARIACIVVAVLMLGLFVVTLPTYYAFLLMLCTSASCGYGQLSANGTQVLSTIGLSLNGYAILLVILTVIAALPCVAVATLLFWRKSENWVALLVAVMLVWLPTSSTTIIAPVLRPALGPVLAGPIASLFNGFAVLIPLIFSLFPTGRFVPRWIRWLVLTLLVDMVILTLSSPLPTELSFLNTLFWGISGLIMVAAQIYRYRSVSTPAERQQTKWVLFGFSLVILLNFGELLPALFFPSLRQPDSLYQVFSGQTGFYISELLIALSFGLAILRSHLYDIDVLINRTLVYGTLTVTLTLVYVGLVIGLQALLRGIISQDSGVAIVISTLAIAALFQPLRRRIQRLIDRRFYRSKYDAAKTVAAFSATLRNEVDLDQLREQLLTVVQETMQPAHVSLWLRPPAHDEKRKPWRAKPPGSSEGN